MFDNGLMYKAKTDWYMKRSKQATGQVFHEKDIWEMVIKGTIDDYADMLGYAPILSSPCPIHLLDRIVLYSVLFCSVHFLLAARSV